MHHFDRHTASDSPPISRSEISTTKDGPRPRARPQRGALRRAASQARRGYGRRVAQNGALWGGWGVGGGSFLIGTAARRYLVGGLPRSEERFRRPASFAAVESDETTPSRGGRQSTGGRSPD